ncbi:hypothetical protein FRC06_008655, partial [Ceratobasidium sp. 370]
MPKDTVKDIQSLLRGHGLSLRMKDGQLRLEENAGAGAGLPRKVRPIYVYVGPKPAGSPGRGKPDGYNLQEETRMNDDDYSLDDTKTVLERTHGIDMHRAITLQNPRAVDLAVQRLVGVHRELEAFAQHGYWAPCAFIQMVLRSKSCKANTQARQALAPAGPQVEAQQAGAGAQQEAEPATKPPRKWGRPRKVKVLAPEGQLAIEGVPTIGAQPMPQGEPAFSGALAAAAQPVPAIIGQPAPAIAAQPAPAVPIPVPVPVQPSPATAAQPASTIVVQPVPKLPHDDDDVETIDLEIDESEFDVTMASVAHNLSRMSIHAEQVGEDPGDIIE